MAVATDRAVTERASVRTLAAIFAHPDDETFAIGGTLARYGAAGVRCVLYCATDGDAGRASGLAVASRAQLGGLRRMELVAAAQVLGIGAIGHGGHPDGALGRVDADALVGEIVDFLRDHRPDLVLTFGPEGAPTAHRDHRAISRAATAAFFLAGLEHAYVEQLAAGRAPHQASRLYYVTWEPPPAEGVPVPRGLAPSARVVLDERLLDAKRRAFDAHRSQHELRPRFDELALKPEELFHLASGTPQPQRIVDDLFAGL